MQRIITSVIIGTAWLLLLFYVPFWVFWLVTCLIGSLMLYEYAGLVLANPPASRRILYASPGLLPLLTAYFGRSDIISTFLALAFLLLFIIILLQYSSLEDGFKVLSHLGFGIIYIGFFLAHLTLIRFQPNGIYWLLALSCITVASDTGAFYAGTFLGKHKLCPRLSPGKTVEGFIGGLICGTAAGLIIAQIFLPQATVYKMTLITMFITGAGVVGDLTESIIKRSMQVKDSSNLLPGHGGLLDRLDSMLIAAPLFYYFLFFGILPA